MNVQLQLDEVFIITATILSLDLRIVERVLPGCMGLPAAFEASGNASANASPNGTANGSNHTTANDHNQNLTGRTWKERSQKLGKSDRCRYFSFSFAFFTCLDGSQPIFFFLGCRSVASVFLLTDVCFLELLLFGDGILLWLWIFQVMTMICRTPPIFPITQLCQLEVNNRGHHSGRPVVTLQTIPFTNILCLII